MHFGYLILKGNYHYTVLYQSPADQVMLRVRLPAPADQARLRVRLPASADQVMLRVRLPAPADQVGSDQRALAARRPSTARAPLPLATANSVDVNITFINNN